MRKNIELPESSPMIDWDSPPRFDELPESSPMIDWDSPPRFDHFPVHAAHVVPDVHVEQEAVVVQVLPQEVHVEREAVVLQVLPQEVHVEREAVELQGLPQVMAALRMEGLASIKIIFGIDFNITNDWKGKYSFDGKSLHDTGYTHNPYEKVISIIGKTLEPFRGDNKIQCYGFGDESTRDKRVFGFYHDHSLCNSFQEVLCRYRKILPNLRPAGPISYAPVVDATIDIVNKSCGEYHILFIITDGQGIGSDNTSDEELSPQRQSIESIIEASSYPLSIVLVGVGDGPWEDIQKFEEKVLAHKCDNFQFVNFTEIMSEKAPPSENETAFATAALLTKIPNQCKAAIKRGMPRQNVTGNAKQFIVLPPPVPVIEQSNSSSSMIDTESQQACTICYNGKKVIAFLCGHQTCTTCGSKLEKCPFCREPISNRIRLL